MIIINKQEITNHPEILAHIITSGEQYQIDALELGDFLIQGVDENVVIERKAINDFWASVIDNRLWSQTKDLSRAEDDGYRPIIIIELQNLGELRWNPKTKRRQYIETELFKINELQFYNSLLAVQKWGVDVVLTSSPQGTGRFLVYLSRKLSQPKEKKDYPERSGFKKNMTLDQKRQYLFDAFGHETGKILKANWKTLLNRVMSKPKEEAEAELSNLKLASGRRIGEKKAKEIFEILFGD